MSHKNIINKDNLDIYLKELAKEYKKISGRKMPAEIVIIGGASVLINYGFRFATEDIDCMIASSSAMKDAIYKTAERLGLPDDWINTDFKFTTSYSDKIPLYSKYYKTYSNIVQIRTLNAEYLIAMKLRAARTYKYDLSDIVGVLKEEKKKGNVINKNMIIKASKDLYGDDYKLDSLIEKWLDNTLNDTDFEKQYLEYRKEEEDVRERVIEFRKEHSEFKVNHQNIKDLAEELKKKMK